MFEELKTVSFLFFHFTTCNDDGGGGGRSAASNLNDSNRGLAARKFKLKIRKKQPWW